MKSKVLNNWLKIVKATYFWLVKFIETVVMQKRWRKFTTDHSLFANYTVGWWNLRQTCPLVSRVGITGQTTCRADVTNGKADQGWPLNFARKLTAPWRFESSPYSTSHVFIYPQPIAFNVLRVFFCLPGNGTPRTRCPFFRTGNFKPRYTFF